MLFAQRPGGLNETKYDLIWELPLIEHGKPQVCSTNSIELGGMVEFTLVFSLNYFYK